MKRLYAIVAVGLAVSIGATVALAAPGDRPGNGKGDVRGGPPELKISGSAGPVYPLVDTQLAITIENPMSFTIEVTEVTVTVGDASPACSSDNLSVDAVAVPFSVPSRGAATITTTTRLVDSVGDGCQGATFPLQFHAIAVRW